MTTTLEIQEFYNRLLELKEVGYDVDFDDSGNHKNYMTYWIGRRDGNAEYKDCVIMYNGNEDDKYPENVCKPDDIPANELTEKVNTIVQTIDAVFNK